MHIYLLIILCLLTGHQDKDQWNLFHMVLGFNICIDGPELSEGVAAQLEGTIYKPRLGFAEELKLFFGGKDKMVSFVDSYICSKKAISNVILFQTEIQVYWVFVSRLATCARNFGFERLGHGPSSFLRRTYRNEEGEKFYKLMSNQSHLTQCR